MKGFGTCTKGPCMKRYDFSESKPHRHVSPGKCGVVDLRGDPFNVSAECEIRSIADTDYGRRRTLAW